MSNEQPAMKITAKMVDHDYTEPIAIDVSTDPDGFVTMEFALPVSPRCGTRFSPHD